MSLVNIFFNNTSKFKTPLPLVQNVTDIGMPKNRHDPKTLFVMDLPTLIYITIVSVTYFET